MDHLFVHLVFTLLPVVLVITWGCCQLYCDDDDNEKRVMPSPTRSESPDGYGHYTTDELAMLWET